MNYYYPLVRTLHLYFGLFISPFIIIFSISVLVLNHKEYFDKLQPTKELKSDSIRLDNFHIQGTDLLTARSIIQQLGIRGEIDWISKTDSTISFPVNKPGSSQWISVNTKTGLTLITLHNKGIFSATTYLHTMPGPHNAKLRGNSFFMKVWRILSDAFVYFILFVSATGVFLWYFLRPERNLGIYSLGFGLMLLFFLLILLF